MLTDIILYPPSNPVAFYIFSYPIRYYGIILAISIFIGIILLSKLLNKKLSKTDTEIFFDILPCIIIASILGARVFYILGNFDFYINNPLEALLINHGGLSIYGAIFFGVAALIYALKKKNIKILPVLDCISIVMPLCQSIGRWGNFFNQEAYGAPYNGLFKLYIDEFHRTYQDISFYHPAFLWESVLDLGVFFILIALFCQNRLKEGSVFCIYLILYAIVRIFVEFIRIDSVMDVFSIPVAVVLSIISIVAASILLILIRGRN